MIKVSMSVCPLHNGHKEFLEKILEYGENIYIQLEGGDDSMKKLTNLLINNEGHSKEKILQMINLIKKQNEFLSPTNRLKILEEYSKNKKGIFLKQNEEITGVAMGSDILYRLLNLSLGAKKYKDLKKIKKIYLIEREGFPIYFNQLEELNNRLDGKVKIINLGFSSYNISGSKIREKYEKEGIYGIKEFVPLEVFYILFKMKK